MAARRPELKFDGEALEFLRVNIKWSLIEPPLTYPMTKFTHPCVLQFALSSNHWRNFVVETLDRNRIGLSHEKMLSGVLTLTVTTKFDSQRDVMNHVRAVFLEALGRIGYLKMSKVKQNFSGLSQSEVENISLNVSDQKLMLLNGKEAVYFVGECSIIETLRKKLGLLHTEISLPKDCQWPVLQSLGVVKHLKVRKIDVEFKPRDYAVLVAGSTCDVEKALGLIKQFAEDICKETVALHSDNHLELLQDKNGGRNLNVLSYFRETLARKKMECHVEIEGDQNTGRLCVCLYYQDNVRSEKLKDVIRGCINDLTFASYQMERIQAFVNEWVEKGKMKVAKNTKKIVTLICTSDMSFKLSDKLQEYTMSCCTKEIKVPPTINDFLGNHGKENLLKLAKMCNVSITLDEKCLVLHVSGLEESINKFKREFKNSYARDVVSLDISSSLILEHIDELHKIADAHECCFQSVFAEPSHKNLNSVVSWRHLRSEGKVTLVTGHMEDLEADFKIVFVTDNLCPLHKHEKYVTDNLPRVTDATVPRLELGKIVDYRIETQCVTRAIVVSRSNAPTRGGRSNWETIKSSLLRLLKDAQVRKARSVAIPVCLLDERLAKACMSAVSTVQQLLLQFETFLCCTQDNVAEIAQMLDDQYQNSGPGYFREIHMDDISMKRDNHGITVHVRMDSLVDMQTDVIVNTVSTTLDLRKGRLSKQILQKAGEEIQTYCKREYPNGINVGEIAITGPGFLKKNSVKKIYHCALPTFNKSTFVKNVKSMVQRCLLEVDMNKYTTIAFPAFGTGNLGYPFRDTAKAMFDAVEEHRRNSINSSVKQVIFALFAGDKNTCEAFCDEEARWKSKQGVRSEKKGFPKLYTDVGYAEDKVKLNVALETDLKHLPSNVVVVVFKFHTGTCSIPVLKCSSTVPRTWNDELALYIQNKDDLSSLKVAVVSMMEYCRKNRITEILISTYKGILGTVVGQINVISDGVQQFLKKETDICLRKVYISVPDSESLDDIKVLLNGENDSSSEKPRWRLTTCEKLEEMIVVGKTMDSVKQAEAKLQDYVYRLQSLKQKESKGAVPKTVKTKDAPILSGEIQSQNQAAKKIKSNDVSAEINPGIIIHLKQLNTFEEWKEEMQTDHDLELWQKDNGTVVAQGSFNSILKFERHLDDMSSQTSTEEQNYYCEEQNKSCTGNNKSSPDQIVQGKHVPNVKTMKALR